MNWMYRLLTVVELFYIFRAIKKRNEEKILCKNCGCPIDEIVEPSSNTHYEPIHQKPCTGPPTD